MRFIDLSTKALATASSKQSTVVTRTCLEQLEASFDRYFGQSDIADHDKSKLAEITKVNLKERIKTVRKKVRPIRKIAAQLCVPMQPLYSKNILAKVTMLQ